jgi:hypothetical protein
MLSSSFLGASHQRYGFSSSRSSDSSFLSLSFLIGVASALTLPFVFAEAFLESGVSESDSSFFRPFVFFADAVPFDFRLLFGLTSSSLSDSSFLAAFFGVAFLALLSLARISFACFSAFFSMAAFSFASFEVRGSSSSEESSPNAAAVVFGGSLPGFFLAANG